MSASGVCASAICYWPDLQMGRAAAASIGLGWENHPRSEYTGFSSGQLKRRDAPAPDVHFDSASS